MCSVSTGYGKNMAESVSRLQIIYIRSLIILIWMYPSVHLRPRELEVAKAAASGRKISVVVKEMILLAVLTVLFELNSGWLVFVIPSFWILLGHDSATFFCVAYWNHNSSSTFSLWDSTLGASMTGMMPKQNWCLHFPCTHNSAAKDFC
jgi:hypothetical protein